MYIYVTGHNNEANTKRFIGTFLSHPPGYPFQITISCNVGMPSIRLQERFNAIPNVKYLAHDNSGYDIGAYQHAARESDADIMVFFGNSTFFKKSGWLQRMVDAYWNHGWAIYGAMCNKGNPKYKVLPHVRTTAFWMPRLLFLTYPLTITTNRQRHPFEHGPDNLTRWVTDNGLKAFSVNWDTEYEEPQWDDHPNGFSRGNQSAVIAFDKFCEPPYYTPK